MKYYIIIFIFLSLFSCKKQEKREFSPIEELLIVEYNYIINSETNQPFFHLFGFSKLDENFRLSTALYGNDGFYYCNQGVVMNDSIEKAILNILSNYSSDTTFLSKNLRVYDGNTYMFIIKEKNQKEVIIKFEPKFLPEDLRFLYDNIYGDVQNSTEYNFINVLRSVKQKVQILAPKIPKVEIMPTITYTPP